MALTRKWGECGSDEKLLWLFFLPSFGTDFGIHLSVDDEMDQKMQPLLQFQFILNSHVSEPWSHATDIKVETRKKLFVYYQTLSSLSCFVKFWTYVGEPWCELMSENHDVNLCRRTMMWTYVGELSCEPMSENHDVNLCRKNHDVNICRRTMMWTYVGEPWWE